MKVGDARRLAEDMGYRLEKVRGDDRWIIRDLYSDVSVLGSHAGLTFTEVVAVLDRARRDV